MDKNLPTIRHDDSVALNKKTGELLRLKDKLITKNRNKDLVDESWMDRLWAWADKNGIGDLEWREVEWHDNGGYWEGLPREKKKLLTFTKLYLKHNQLTELPKEIGNLTNLTKLNLGTISNFIITKEQKEWIEELEENGCDVERDFRLLDTFFDGRIENCNFSYKCPLEWSNLNKTEDENVKYCEECKENVYRIYSEEEFYSQAFNKRCVYIQHIDGLMGQLPGDMPSY